MPQNVQKKIVVGFGRRAIGESEKKFYIFLVSIHTRDIRNELLAGTFDSPAVETILRGCWMFGAMPTVLVDRGLFCHAINLLLFELLLLLPCLASILDA